MPKYDFLICGNAVTLADDFERARALLPDAQVVAVNAAGAHVPADYLFTLHPRKADEWKRRAAKRAGKYVPLVSSGHPTKCRPVFPWVDKWAWDCAGRGTSAWGAVKWVRNYRDARVVVLCGAPIVAGISKNAELIKAWKHEEVAASYQEYIRGDTAYHHNTYSMSGWTREFFGEPGPDALHQS